MTMPDNPVTKVEVIRNQDDPRKYLLTIEVEGEDMTKEEAVRIALARVDRLRRCGVRVGVTVVSENARVEAGDDEG